MKARLFYPNEQIYAKIIGYGFSLIPDVNNRYCECHEWFFHRQVSIKNIFCKPLYVVFFRSSKISNAQNKANAQNTLKLICDQSYFISSHGTTASTRVLEGIKSTTHFRTLMEKAFKMDQTAWR